MKNIFLLFITIIAVFAVWLFLMHTKSEKLSQSLPAISTNVPILENAKLNIDVQGTNTKTDISDHSGQISPAKENLQEGDARVHNMLEARNHPVELWAKVVDQNGISL
jgi:hypothetical protein